MVWGGWDGGVDVVVNFGMGCSNRRGCRVVERGSYRLVPSVLVGRIKIIAWWLFLL